MLRLPDVRPFLTILLLLLALSLSGCGDAPTGPAGICMAPDSSMTPDGVLVVTQFCLGRV